MAKDVYQKFAEPLQKQNLAREVAGENDLQVVVVAAPRVLNLYGW